MRSLSDTALASFDAQCFSVISYIIQFNEVKKSFLFLIVYPPNLYYSYKILSRQKWHEIMLRLSEVTFTQNLNWIKRKEYTHKMTSHSHLYLCSAAVTLQLDRGQENCNGNIKR